MERRVYVEALQKAFSVKVKDASKSKRNRSYSTASNCCGSRVCMKKFCASCESEVNATECTRKIVKVGKQEHLINAQALKQITEQLNENDEIRVHTFVEGMPQEALDRFDAMAYVLPTKKEGEYVELREVLRGKTAIGTVVVRGNEYEVLLTVGEDDRIRMRRLVEQSQLYDVPEVMTTAEPNKQVVQIERQIIERKTVNGYDFTRFRDTRAETEERIIEDVVLHGKQPEVTEVAQETQRASAEEELERLKALME